MYFAHAKKDFFLTLFKKILKIYDLKTEDKTSRICTVSQFIINLPHSISSILKTSCATIIAYVCRDKLPITVRTLL